MRNSNSLAAYLQSEIAGDGEKIMNSIKKSIKNT